MNELTKIEPKQELQVSEPRQPTTLEILAAVCQDGKITQENVSVVKELVQLRREEEAAKSKEEFAKAFFKLKKTLAETNIYADKVATTNSGKVAYTYCSEEEISRALEPILFSHGFVTLFGQRNEDGRTVAAVTLIHEAGHQETREYSVRVGATNAMKDATAADTGSTTTAWRHLMIKMFGLKSRIREDMDARNEGDLATKITAAQADELERRVKESNSNVAAFLKFAKAERFSDIAAVKYPELDAMLRKKEQGR